MAKLDDKLQNIFKDEDALTLFGEVVVKKKATSGKNTGVQANFERVNAFFRKYGVVPNINASDPKESSVAHMLAGIKRNPSCVAQMLPHDEFGLLIEDIAVSGSTKGSDKTSIETEQLGEDETIPSSQDISAVTQNELREQRKQFLLDGYHKEHDREVSQAQSTLVVAFKEPMEKLTKKISQMTGVFHAQSNRHNPDIDAIDAAMKDVTVLQDDLSSMQKAYQEHRAGVDERITNLARLRDRYIVELDALLDAEFPSTVAPTSVEDIMKDADFLSLMESAPESNGLLGGDRAVRAADRAFIDQSNREKCETFDLYKERFDAYKLALENGDLQVSTARSEKLTPGDIFLWDGLIAILTGESIDDDVAKHTGVRLQIVFSNGTEAWLREGSITRCMYAYTDRGNVIVCKRLIAIKKDMFSSLEASTDDMPSKDAVTGHIYVVRTLSQSEELEKISKGALKIGVTKNAVNARLASADKDPTFLCAPVDIVSTYTLHNLEPMKVEKMLHAFFGEVRLKIKAQDRFGRTVTANEWFMVKPSAVNHAIELLMNDTLSQHRYDRRTGKIHNTNP